MNQYNSIFTFAVLLPLCGCTSRLSDFRPSAFSENPIIIDYDIRKCGEKITYRIDKSIGQEIIKIISDAKRKETIITGQDKMINPVLPRYALHLYLLDETVISVMIWTNGKPMLSVEGFRYELTNVQNERRMKVLLESAVVKGN